VVPITSSVLGAVPLERSGMAASAANTSREIGAVAGVAVLVNAQLHADLIGRLNRLGIPPNFQSIVVNAVETGGVPPSGTTSPAGGAGNAAVVQQVINAAYIGISSFAAVGGKLDVSSTDMLLWREADNTTELALLYLESFGNPRRFARTARRLSANFPVLTVHAGRSAPDQRAAASHTAAAAAPLITRQALFEQAGEVLADHAARLAPLTDADADDLIRAIGAARTLLDHEVDIPALRDVLLRASGLADELPQVAELDLNPLMARPDGAVAVDARIRVTSHRLADPFLRQLPQ
jgi:acyl-CoA synthetase (NDP forming)